MLKGVVRCVKVQFHERILSAPVMCHRIISKEASQCQCLPQLSVVIRTMCLYLLLCQVSRCNICLFENK